MEITFQLTPEDYKKSTLYTRRKVVKRSLLRFFSTGWGCLYGLLIGFGQMLIYRYGMEYGCISQKPLYWGLGLALTGIIMLAINPHIHALAYKRALFRKGGYYCSPQTFKVEDGHLLHRQRSTESRFAWTDILAIEEDRDYLYVFLDPVVSFIIPRRAFNEPSAFHQFKTELSRHISRQG
ncbi:YcxB family protein [Zoogloea sp.]|uniref:YcxB family protein n=1 Tax=Zoogloea sp. TaxID=49181 RepID=UPI0025CF1440|nr:YcxB family protein [Zoogloea sp.]MCK6393632.1 YcxB family protein [Zoogloea sp.]